ncbi:MAG: type 2 isopentenyl-diphosphate Delta-isomerase [Candidatus Micrarchaeia archaeon]
MADKKDNKKGMEKSQNENYKIEQTIQRKDEHINICLEKPVQAKSVKTLFNDVHLLNNSLPEIDFEDIDTSVNFLGKKFSAPIMVGAMTGGTPSAKKINENIAKAMQELKLGMALGSQRAALMSADVAASYSIAREAGPDIFLGANIGAAQLAELGIENAKKLIKMVNADALYIHLNAAQEVAQPEGEPHFANILKNIEQISKSLEKPIIAKEVGFGISPEAAKRLENAGVSAIEIAGAGGTSYTAVEYYRALEQSDYKKMFAAQALWDWGIPTAASLYMARKEVSIPIISSGGIRTPLDIAKSIAMGADMTAIAWPFLKLAVISADAVKSFMSNLIYGLKSVMFLVGAKNIEELKHTKYIISGELKEWVENERVYQH